jgi:hypothetical protein
MEMTLDQAIQLIEQCSDRMNEKYGGIVFDEWLVVRFGENDTIVAHSGPRGERLIEDYSRDIQAIHNHIISEGRSIGDFAFTHQGHGTRFDAFVMIGESLFLLWNNTGSATTHITRNPSWKVAQTEFVALTDVIRENPVVLPSTAVSIA